MSATQYTADVKDLMFVLFDQLKIDEEFAKFDKYEDYDRELYESTIYEAQKIAEEVLGPMNGPGDRQGCHIADDGTITTPEGYKEAWTLVAEGGWLGVSAPAEYGGVGMPLPIGMAVNEMFSGAAMAFTIYTGLTSAAARMVYHYGHDISKEIYIEKLWTGEWAGTMLLTEAGAGSAVGDSRTKATRTDEPGVYKIEGEKIFISGGDHDLAENIIHLVLARTPDAPAGTKGLSLFIVPKVRVDAEGNLLEGNDVVVSGIEHKMGINGSATCTVTLGANDDCYGYLVEEEGAGMRLMFNMMNEARIGVGAQGVAVAGSAYNYAVAYAKERVQGVDIREIGEPDAKSVPIVLHPDIRRMLMTIKCQTEALRSLLYKMAFLADLAEVDEGPLADKRLGTVDLLVPVLKAHATDVGFEAAVHALQIYGGYGYISEYPVEQLVRDAKIGSIYEGTNGIQAMDLLGRKMRLQGGMLFMSWMQEAQAEVRAAKAEGFEDEGLALEKAIGHLGATAMHLGGVAMKGDLSGGMLQAYPFLKLFGTVLLGIESLAQARVAQKLIDERGEDEFLVGKLLNLKFYVANILGTAISTAKAIQAGDDSCLDERLWPLEG